MNLILSPSEGPKTPISMVQKIRYAVVGLGHFAQVAILPAFRQAQRNSELVALVSDDPHKHRVLGKKYNVELHGSCDDYDSFLQNDAIDAVYIALPNHLHAEYAVRAAQAGKHVLCEKPMALHEDECRQMITACQRNNVRLMVAYRLHFEKINLEVMNLVSRGAIGEPKFFSSAFSHQVMPGNIRTLEQAGGGALWDIGVYCVNAARYIFKEEPIEVFSWMANSDPQRFKHVDEVTAGTLRFKGNRFAQFTASQGAADTSHYRIVGTEGDIAVEPAYEYQEGLAYTLTRKGKSKRVKSEKHGQVAAELVYFSKCILNKHDPEPSGLEGMADVRVLNALQTSARSGQAVAIHPLPKKQRPSIRQEITRPSHPKVEPVHATAASR